MIVSRMQQSDLLQVAEIEQECFSQPWSRKGFEDAIAMENNIFLVAKEQDDVLGYIGMYVSLDEGEITNVAVRTNRRNSGIAGHLVSALKEYAREQSVFRMVLEVRVSNTPAIQVYEKAGFINVGVRKGFYDFPKEDAYIMVCEMSI